MTWVNVAPVPVLGEWQPWEPHVARLHLLEVRLRLRWGACYGDSVAVASGGTGCTLRGWWVIAYTRPDHLCNNWMILFVLHDPDDCLDESMRTTWRKPKGVGRKKKDMGIICHKILLEKILEFMSDKEKGMRIIYVTRSFFLKE